jgi:hypothetical protein
MNLKITQFIKTKFLKTERIKNQPNEARKGQCLFKETAQPIEFWCRLWHVRVGVWIYASQLSIDLDRPRPRRSLSLSAVTRCSLLSWLFRFGPWQDRINRVHHFFKERHKQLNRVFLFFERKEKNKQVQFWTADHCND